MKPEFVDNKNGNTLVAALSGHMQWLDENYRSPACLSIATGYFNPAGFFMLAEQLDRLANVRLLIGAEPSPPPQQPRRMPGEPRGEDYDAMLIEDALERLEQGLLDDRNLLGLSPETNACIERLLAFLESGRIEVRRYEHAFLHGKAYVFNDDEGVIAGSSNFTAAGLTSNLELNLGRYDPTPVRQVKQWFDELWEEATPYNLAEVYQARIQEYPPYVIFMRVLWELYHEELESAEDIDGRLGLTNFQTDGVERAKRILDNYDGVIIADGVGLGKSFIAGELIRETVQDRRQRALLISPAALRDGTWARFLHRNQLYVENLSYEQLAAERQLGGDASYLNSNIQEYALIVIDESQAFRNPGTERARALRLLLRGTPPKKLVQLSATPVNNSLWDLYNLLTYFIGHDARFAHQGIPSLKERFREAVNENPYDLEPDMLFDILDATTVRRTRDFVRRWYAHDRIPGPDGELIPIRFPTSHVSSVTYELDEILPGFFEEFEVALMPEQGLPLLTMARYTPLNYIREGVEFDREQFGREMGLIGLLRSGLLKRFESSSYAFANTATRMADSHDAFLAALDHGFLPTPAVMEEWGEVDNDEAFEELLRDSESVPAEDYEIDRLRHDVTADRDLLRSFAAQAQRIQLETDPKLISLVEELAEIASQAEHEADNEQEVRNKRKVLIFSYFSDTVEWIERYVRICVEQDPRLAVFRGRIASVNSTNNQNEINRRDAVFGFAPISSEAPPSLDEDRFDILITTDVLAEGQNLQQARNIINYDLPWNPMRLVQRNGRIDRIGSPHEDIYIRCFFPDQQLDALLRLEDRIRRKLAQAAATIGLEGEVIPDGATNDVVFSETRAEIEALRQENAEIFERAGQEIGAYSGEEYRQILRQGVDRLGDQIFRLPWAAGSGLGNGLQKGHFFCARIGRRVYLRFVPYEDDDEIIRDTLGCLRMIDCRLETPRYMPEDLTTGVFQAWNTAKEDIYLHWTEATDPANLQPRIPKAFRDTAAHLRAYPPDDTSQEDLDLLLDAVEAPWGARIGRELREILRDENITHKTKSNQLKEKIAELGLQPFIAPEPLPVIERDEVQLICWMAVDTVEDVPEEEF